MKPKPVLVGMSSQGGRGCFRVKYNQEVCCHPARSPGHCFAGIPRLENRETWGTRKTSKAAGEVPAPHYFFFELLLLFPVFAARSSISLATTRSISSQGAGLPVQISNCRAA